MCPKPTADAPADDPEPKLDDAQFTEYDQWVTAHGRWSARQEIHAENTRREQAESERRATEARTADEQRRQTALAENQKRVEAFVAEHADYEEVVKQAEGAPTEEIVTALVESVSGPAMAYYLGQHPDEYQAIRALSGPAAYRALGKIEAKVEAASAPAPEPPAPEPPKKSSAPEPVTPTRGTAVAAGPNVSDYQAYKAKRQGQLKAQGKTLL